MLRNFSYVHKRNKPSNVSMDSFCNRDEEMVKLISFEDPIELIKMDKSISGNLFFLQKKQIAKRQKNQVKKDKRRLSIMQFSEVLQESLKLKKLEALEERRVEATLHLEQASACLFKAKEDKERRNNFMFDSKVVIARKKRGNTIFRRETLLKKSHQTLAAYERQSQKSNQEYEKALTVKIKAEAQLKGIMKEIKALKTELFKHYHQLLKQVSEKGISLIICKIWELGDDVLMSFLPNFIDSETIKYIFEVLS